MLPVDRARFRNLDQPVTLSIQNSVITQAGTTTYTFEVATDTAFSAKVQIKDNVAEGTGGQTSIKLDTLPPTRTTTGTRGPSAPVRSARSGPPARSTSAPPSYSPRR